jgi:PIN domain nuclease of toxin-antitoxin system
VILLDTHAWFWAAAAPEHLSARAVAAIKEAATEGGMAVASISLFELVSMMARGRVQSRGTPETALTELIASTGVVVKEITPTIAALTTHLPGDFPGDPADRLIAATARAEGLVLVTKDARIRASNFVRTVW